MGTDKIVIAYETYKSRFQDDIDKLMETCVNWMRFSYLTEDTVIEAWINFSESKGEDWLPPYGSQEEIFKYIKPYLPRLAEQDRSGSWYWFSFFVMFMTGIVIATTLLISDDYSTSSWVFWTVMVGAIAMCVNMVSAIGNMPD